MPSWWTECALEAHVMEMYQTRDHHQLVHYEGRERGVGNKGEGERETEREI